MDCGNVKKELYESTLDNLIIALCLDFERRHLAVLEDKLSRRTIMEYRYINYRMEDAAMEIAGVRLGPIYINEIGSRIGYAYSDVDCLSEAAYKREKREVKINIARKLHLID